MEELAANFAELFNPEHALANLTAFFSVILIDLALAGDNAVAVGLAASALAPHQQRRAIFWGIVIALVLRIIFATITAELLEVPGLLLLGGLLLFWVAWRMWDDLRQHQPVMVGQPEAGEHFAEAIASRGERPKTFQRALFTIILADVSMSLDNVLAVAAVSKHNHVIMWFGLILSVLLMGVAATFIARIINRYRWIALAGIAIIVFAAIRLVWEDVHCFSAGAVPGVPSWLGGGHQCPTFPPSWWPV